ncbi:MAG TPA: hypothetical protein VF771_16790, partial [Longimicrobiaceae bacterium]
MKHTVLSPWLRATLSAALVAAAACTERNPASPPAPTSPATPASAAELRCSADVHAGTLACAPTGGGAAPGISAAILGGQG